VKKVLVIDDSDLFREFITEKLQGFGFEVAQAVNGFDGLLKLRSENPELIIMDFYLSRNPALEILEKKSKDPNLKNVPVIMASAKIDRENLLAVSQYGVRKFFTKPIKVDAFVKAVSEALGVNLEVDATPCIIDANFNDEILFIEVARGFNKDKIEMLKYRLDELAALHHLSNTKVLLLMSGLDIQPNDTLLLSSLLVNIMDHSKAHPKGIRILTNSNTVKTFLAARDQFKGIEVSKNIESAMDDLLGNRAGNFMDEGNNVVAAHFFTPLEDGKEKASGVNLHFEVDNASKGFDLSEVGPNLRIAVVDDDPVLRQIMKKSFEACGAKIDTFDDGKPFLTCPDINVYDLVFLDLMMPGVDGFHVLEAFKKLSINPPTIILSALSKRETVVKALNYGVKSYMIKPVKPDAILKKTIEILKTDF